MIGQTDEVMKFTYFSAMTHLAHFGFRLKFPEVVSWSAGKNEGIQTIHKNYSARDFGNSYVDCEATFISR